jgi:alpha-tubulin suppressor-like RCC1 family protein
MIVYANPEAIATAKVVAHDNLRRAQASSTASSTPLVNIKPSQNQPGLSSNDNNLLTTGTPSDSTGAIGPVNYVEMINQRVAAYNRSLALIGSTVDLSNFVNPNGRGGTTTDPQIEWDAQAGRWLYAAVEVQAGANYLLYGWSKTSDPTNFSGTGWCRWDLSTGNDFEDYPKLGHDSTSIVIGANLLDYPNGGKPSFVTATIFTFTKPASGVTSCSQPSFNQFGTRSNPLHNGDGSLSFTPVPANTTDSGANDYIAAAHNGAIQPFKSAIMVWHLSYGKKGVPTLVADGDLSVAGYQVPPSAPQASSPNYLDTLDTRLTQAVARVDPDAAGNTAIWTQHTISEPSNAQPLVRWYELIPATQTVRQSGDANSGVMISNFNGSISPTIDGNEAVLQYNQSSSTQLPSIVVLSRLGSTPLGQMDPVVTSLATIGTSPSAENDNTCGGTQQRPCRWGDYSSVTPDPSANHTVWGTGALTGSNNFGLAGWTTRNFAVTTLSTPYCLTATIAGGYYHSLAVGLDGTVWAWGATGLGQIGAGRTTTNQLTPTQVLGQGGSGLLTGISYVAAGQYHSLGLRASDGSVWAWGNNLDGELGNNDPTGANQFTPVQVVYASTGTPLTGVSDIATRNSHSLAIRKSDGTVWSWGLNTYGQLGNSSVPLTQSRAAVQVIGLGGVVKIATGDNFSVAIDSSGFVWAWGDDSNGQLGDNVGGFGAMSVVPIKVHGLHNVGVLVGGLKVASRQSGTDVINSDHTLSAWGIGNQPSTATPLIVPTSTGSGSLFPMFAVGAGLNVTYAVDYSDYTLWDWGDNGAGELGDGTTTFRPSPVHVQNSSGGLLSSVFYATGGGGHSIAVLQSGAVDTWGLNSGGQLGDGTTNNRPIPYQVALPAIQTPTSC